MREFSAKLVTRTKQLENEVDDLVDLTTATKINIHNVMTEFNLLAASQFIENVRYPSIVLAYLLTFFQRVYEVEDDLAHAIAAATDDKKEVNLDHLSTTE